VADDIVRNLLLLYAGAVLLNVVVSSVLYFRDRKPIYRSLVVCWAAMLVSFGAQGVLSAGQLQIVIGFATAFLVNFAFARLLASTANVHLRWQPYSAALIAGVGSSVVLHTAGFGFTATALPVVVPVALPCLVTVVRLLRARSRLSTAKFVLVIGCVLFSLHNLDFALLRNRPEFAAFGFTVAILVVFMLAIAGAAVALEQVTEQQVRLATELDVARRLQSQILPRDVRFPGVDISYHVRPTNNSVGGDYLDLYRDGQRYWFLLGDVTGHGLGAGLVMLMAQSTMTSLLRARPDLTPRELNFLANGALAENLARLGERRHLTAISMLREAGGEFVFSGSHDGLLVYRAASAEVELYQANHFPMGLGFSSEFVLEDFREERLQVAAGDVVLLFTDGITEAAPHGDARVGMFGTEPIRRLLLEYARQPLDQLKQAVLDELDRFTHGVYHDDVAMLLIRLREEAT
jgi:serine phosphatase RsbU (regulator of sigma subunit)